MSSEAEAGVSGVDVEALRALLLELREGRADYDGRSMPDHAEPFGIDCGVLRRAEEAVHALLAKSAAYDELVARVEGAPLADIAEDGKHNGTSSLLSAAIAAGYYNGQRVRLVLEDSDATDFPSSRASNVRTLLIL